MNNIKIIALFGKSGSGKNYIKSRFAENEKFNIIIPSTTRPKRKCEKDRVDYNFYDDRTFLDMFMDEQFIEVTCFNNNWFYGTEGKQLSENKINVGIFNIKGIEILSDQDFKIFPLEIVANDRIRLKRILEREVDDLDCKEVCRRFLKDEKDFETIDFHYHKFYNNEDSEYIIPEQLLDFIYNKE